VSRIVARLAQLSRQGLFAYSASAIRDQLLPTSAVTPPASQYKIMLRISESMTIIQRLRRRIREDRFRPSLLSLLFNPEFIIRRGLYSNIRSFANMPAGSLLDFGCGSKPYRSLFSKATRYVGVDLAVTGHNHNDSQIDVFYDGRVLPFPDEDFDAVLSFEVFEHVFNLPEVLNELRRVTRESGYLLISIPFAWGEHEEPYDFCRYTRFGISDVLERAGYEVLEVKRSTTFFLAICQLFINYLTQMKPRARVLLYLRQLAIVFPITVVACILDLVFPKRYEFFCNIVLLARKKNQLVDFRVSRRTGD
jgi:SAM-dependent methyltransferase